MGIRKQIGFFEGLESRRLLNGYLVTSALDSGPGTLRQAISDANAHVGADVVTFAIAGAGVHRITSSGGMPAISDELTIDGTSQPGYAGKPLVELVRLDGVGNIGLLAAADGCVIKGLAIDGYANNFKLMSSGNSVEGNYLGLLAD